MKIAVCLVTRGNPKRAAAVIECARSLASDDHQIEYLIGIDADDTESYNFFRQQYPGLVLSVDKRPKGVGAVWNRLVARARRDFDPDVYCPFPDDSFIGCPLWDDVIFDTFEKKFKGAPVACHVLGWNDLANPNQCTLPIASREWIDMTGKLYDERFPFWFYDTAVTETFSYIMGQPVPCHPGLILAARKGITQRMRDLEFWWEFFAFTRKERLENGEKYRRQLGIELHPGVLDECIKAWERRDRYGLAASIEMEAEIAERKPPTPEYMEAKAEAAALMGMELAA